MVSAYFFGRFDPIHNGHTALINAAITQVPDIQELIIVPAYAPPHKQGFYFDFDTRCRFINLVLSDPVRINPSVSIIVSDIEKTLPSPTYTIDSLKTLEPQLADTNNRVPFIMGLDSFLSLPSWKEAQSLVNIIDIWVACRPGYAVVSLPSDLQALNVKYHPLEMSLYDVSATELRDALEANNVTKLKEHLPADVLLEINNLNQVT